MEPFKVKMVEAINVSTREERLMALQEAYYNPFSLQAKDVTIDLLSDSGTAAMSQNQWAALMKGDESYAGAESYYRFEKAVRDITHFKYILPTHQGRAAERILMNALLKDGDLVLSNTFFDTTRGNVESRKAVALDIPAEFMEDVNFKGNINLTKLLKFLSQDRKKVAAVILTVTNNRGGGQPVSMGNIRELSKICHRYNIPLYADACRYAENAYFIKIREQGFQDKTPIEIAREMFSYFDGCTMSAKKDGLVNMGGFLATNDETMHSQFLQDLIISEGFKTYGGLSGRDLDAIAVGLYEGLKESYLKYRINSTWKFGEILKAKGVPILEPTGGHALFIDAAKFLPNIPQSQYPAWSLNCALYVEGGIRGGEMGGVAWGLQADGTEKAPEQELVRLAIPRRVYTISHFEYVGDVLSQIAEKRHLLSGYAIVWQAMDAGPMRQFTARLKPIEGTVFKEENTNTDNEMQTRILSKL